MANEKFTAENGVRKIKTFVESAVNTKQDRLTFDNIPTSGSSNPVKSNGIYVSINGKQDTLISGTNIKTINSQSILGSGDITIEGDSLLVETTWSALKTLRDNSQLVPGQQYRITDYTCTTVDPGTQSAGHQFDIIVTADNVNKLNENARACLHANDTYFTDSKLESWELKYCVDNDTTRFAWADTSTGKGVIYYMKDEFNNECSYDFKNIQFGRQLTNGQLDEESGTYNYCYTFNVWDNSTCKDLSVAQLSSPYDDCCYQNKINSYIGTMTSGKISLNNIVFLALDLYAAGILQGTHSNYFGVYCRDMTFNKSCYSNTFGNDCYNNIFGYLCFRNTFGHYCHDNTISFRFISNSFGHLCTNNTVGNNCSHNTFENYCRYNTLGNNCSYNTFENNCFHDTLVSLGNTNYAKNNVFENGVSFVDLQASEAGTTSLQNIKIRQGIQGTDSTHKVITEARGLTHDVTYRAVGAEDKAI